MKKNALLLSLLCLTIFACKKDDPDPVSNPKPNNPTGDTISYYIDGVQDISLQRTDSVQMPVQLIYRSGPKEKVSMAIAGLPKNMTLGFTVLEDTPSYNSVITFIANKVVPGTYPLTLIGNSLSAGTRQYPFTLVVTRYSNEARNMEGSYQELGNCAILGGRNNLISAEADAQVQHRILFKGLWSGAAYEVYADLNPANQSLQIPQQLVNGANFSGNGTYNDTLIELHYAISNSIFSDTCGTWLKRTY